MPIKNTFNKYGSVAKFFHWLTFLLIAGMLTVGFLMTGMESSPDKFKVYRLHKSVGVVALIIVSLRLMWKSVNVAPKLPDAMSRIEKFLAQAGHAALYALTVAMPLTGWAMSSAAGFPVSVFGLFTLPDLVTPDKELRSDFAALHELVAYALILMVILHVSAALLHHFYHKDNVLRRMLPYAKLKEEIHAQDSDTMAGC